MSEEEKKALKAIKSLEEAFKQWIEKIKEILQKIQTAIKQALCKHEEVESFTPKTKFSRISGETIYIRCVRCGKIIDKITYDYKGFGYK